MTSDPLSEPGASRRTLWFVFGSWVLMVLLGVVWIARYTANSPWLDEWEFVPALLDEEPTLPWLWKQHNEHRFPLPRMIYYPLFKLTHDFRTGCYVSLLGVSLLSLGMIRLARQLRGRLHWSDAFFPLSLMHLGHFENYRMGYQICFMLIAVFAGLILRAILLTSWNSLYRRGLQVGLLLIPLLGCGAGGLAFGPPLTLWLLAILISMAFGFLKPSSVDATQKRSLLARSAVLLSLIGFVPAFIALYFYGYVRPEFHPQSAGVLPSLRIALQTLTMAFGIAAGATPDDSGFLGFDKSMSLWGIAGFLVAILGFECVVKLIRVLSKQPEDRPRAFGILLFLGAVGLMAFGIGWGRSGFPNSANMGLVSRYGWIMWPALAAIYFMWLLYGSAKLSRQVPIGLCLIVILLLPFNIGTGFQAGEDHRALLKKWEAAVREGDTDEELIDEFYQNYPEHVQERIRVALRLMRAHRIGYYFPLREPIHNEGRPHQPDNRKRTKKRSVSALAREGHP